MNKKKLLIIGIILAVIIIAVILISVFVKKKIEIDKEYVLLPEEQFTYYVLNVDDKYGVAKKDGSIVINPEYDEVQIPNRDQEIFVVKKGNDYSVLNANNEKILEGNGEVTGIEGTNSWGKKVYNNTVLKYQISGKYGLLSFDGKRITDAIYEELVSLEEKYGEIRAKKDGKFGVINIKGVILVHAKYDYVRGDGYSNNDSNKEAGYIVGVKSDKGMSYGYLDKTEKEIIKPEQETLYRVTEIKDGNVYLVASQNGRYALYKNKDNVTDYKYLRVDYSNSGKCFIVQKNKTYGVVNLDGKVVIPEEYDELLIVGIYVRAYKDDQDYIFDLNGAAVEDSPFTSLAETSTGRFYISIDDNYRYGLANKQKEVVVPNIYDYIQEVDKTGILIATEGKNVTVYSAGGSEIISAEDADYTIEGDYIKIITPEESFYLTTDGKKVTSKTVYLDNKLFASKQGKKWGFVDLKDNTQVDYIYDQVTEFNEFGFAGVKKDGKWGVINQEGEVILEPTYEIYDDNSPVFIGIYYKNGDILTNNV